MASFIVNIFIAASVFTTILGQNYSYLHNINRLINGTQNYFRITQAELLVKVKLAEIENDAIDARFLDRLAIIEMQQQQVLNATQQLNETIIPLQALSLVRKYCIQTYDAQFITYKSANEKFKACTYSAQRLVNSFTSDARRFTNYAKDYATDTLPRRLQNCQSYNNSQTLIEQCFIDICKNTADFVQGYLSTAGYYRKKNIFDMNEITSDAVQCSFGVEKVVLQAIALTSRKINDCLDDLKNKTDGSVAVDGRQEITGYVTVKIT